MQPPDRQLRRIRILIAIVIAGLIVSGITAFPLVHEVASLDRFVQTLGLPDFITVWIAHVHQGIAETNAVYPFIAYGTDWLAFGHLIIALFMVGAFIDPVRNIWLIRAGMIACILVIPLALTCGAVRGIPLWWRGIDSLFGIIGFIPLWIASRIVHCLPGFPNFPLPDSSPRI